MEHADSAPAPSGVGAKASWKIPFLLVAVAATAAIAPFFFAGNASGHDIQFHLSSWMDVAGQWREGTFYPRWAEWANWGFGEPRFIFYPPLSWMLGAVLGLILPWKATPGAFIWLALILAGMAMWRLAREWLPEAQAAIAAVFFAVNPYNLAIVYYRSDFAELMGVALLPLLVWGALRMIRCNWRYVPHVAIVFAAIWLANAPEGVIATYSLALVLLIATARQRSAQPLLIGSAAMAAGFGLAAFYILPAAWERGWVQISGVLTTNLLPQHNFLFTHSSDAEFQLFNWKISGVAVGTMLATTAAVAVAWPRRRSFGKIWWMLLGLGFASALMMLPVSLELWRHLPELVFLQFPWRWLAPLSVALALFAAAAISGLRRHGTRQIATALVLVLIGITGALIATSTWWNSEDAALIAGEIQSGHGYEGVDEYQPTGDDRTDLPNATPDAEEMPKVPATLPVEIFDADSGKVSPTNGDVKIDVQKWAGERKRFEIEADAPVTLAVRLLNYPAWDVQEDGKSISPEAAPETAEMLLALAPGQHEVEIRFARTPDRIAGDAISALSVIGLAGFVLIKRKRRSTKAGGA
ncbi:MAG TPA: 6-pyruvoyl-tetrahydropterin synthase-related protein [Candidatus Acidoferrales bacterium]|jgi:hypothetical protein|nr:6-pyruvoyl-tetrahydropterin synthase-related protein [Candidatus Acidoferrales bacterium]